MASEKIIALIDDDEDILNFLNYNLVKKGYKVILFSDCNQILDSLKKSKPTLIISDWMLPGKQGIDLLMDIRKDDELRTTPFVMISCNNSYTDISKAFNKGINDYFVKPFKIADFLTRVDHLTKLAPGKD